MGRKGLVIFSFILLQIHFCYTQNSNLSEIDSIIELLKKKGTLDERISYQKQAVRLANSIRIDSLIRKANVFYGLNSYYKRDLKGIKESYKNLKNLDDRNKDSLALAKYYHLLSLKNRIEYKVDSSFYFYNLSKDISAIIGDSIQTGFNVSST